MDVATAILKLVAADALPAIVGSLVVGNLVRRDFEPLVAEGGDVVGVPVAPLLCSDGPRQAGYDAQVVLNSRIEASFLIPDVTKVLAVPDLLRLYMQPAVIAISQKIESDLLNLYAGFTSNAPLGAAGTLITEEVVDQAEASLFNARIPSSEPKYLVVDGGEYAQMRRLTRFREFLNPHDAGLRTMANGPMGTFKGFFVFRSPLVPKTGSWPAMATHNLAFAKEAAVLVIRRLPLVIPGSGSISEYAELGNFGIRVTMTYQPNTLSQLFTIDLLYGAGILRNSNGVVVRS